MNRMLWVLLVLSPWTLGAQTPIREAEVKELLAQDKSVVLLDVRTAEEFAAGHIAGSRLLPYDAIDGPSAARAIPVKTAKVIVYCRSGRRSALAAQTLKGLGYTQVFDFGALSRWSGPLVTGPK